MLTQEEDVEIHALAKRGWAISEIAHHMGRDRETVWAHLSGEYQPGVRVSTVEDPLDRIEAYVAQRLADGHGVQATVLFDEVAALGYDRSHPTFTRKLRERASDDDLDRPVSLTDGTSNCREPWFMSSRPID